MKFSSNPNRLPSPFIYFDVYEKGDSRDCDEHLLNTTGLVFSCGLVRFFFINLNYKILEDQTSSYSQNIKVTSKYADLLKLQNNIIV